MMVNAEDMVERSMEIRVSSTFIGLWRKLTKLEVPVNFFSGRMVYR